MPAEPTRSPRRLVLGQTGAGDGWVHLMKLTSLIAMGGIALFVSIGVCAQTSSRAPTAPMAPGVTTHVENPTESEFNRQAIDVDPEAPTAGHDDATGNNLIAPDTTSAEKATAQHPDFLTLDTNNRGFLTADDVRFNQWLSANFMRCDANHDGRLSQQEYANCR
jgi:hypothetical protein